MSERRFAASVEIDGRQLSTGNRSLRRGFRKIEGRKNCKMVGRELFCDQYGCDQVVRVVSNEPVKNVSRCMCRFSGVLCERMAGEGNAQTVSVGRIMVVEMKVQIP